MKREAVIGIGVDLVENDRMRAMLKRWNARFKSRVFLRDEQAYCESKAAPWRHYAARFAVKEAVSKAFGTGVGPHLSWLDITVTNDPATGAPSVKLSRKARALARKRGIGKVLVSLAHTHSHAVAYALLAGKYKGENSSF